MPAKTKNKRSARGTRKSPAPGKKRQAAARQPGQGSEATTGILADSFFTLKVKAKPGTEVFFNREGIAEGEGVIEDLYGDLWAAYRNAHRLVKGEELTVNPALCYPGLHLALEYILKSFKKLLPVGFQYNIDFDYPHGHYFTLFKCCEWHYGWNRFPIRYVVTKLNRECPKLHDLFLCFIRAFCKITGVDLWAHGMMSGTLEMLEDSFSQTRGELTKDEAVDMAADIRNYKRGEAFKYARLIGQADLMEPEEIIKRVKRFKKAEPIVNLIHQGCALLLPRYSLYDYTYQTLAEEENPGWYLDLDCQCNIIWDDGDSLTHDHEYSLDAYAQEGIQEPVCSFKLTAETGQLDFDALQRQFSWPLELYQFFNRANELIEEYIL